MANPVKATMLFELEVTATGDDFQVIFNRIARVIEKEASALYADKYSKTEPVLVRRMMNDE